MSDRLVRPRPTAVPRYSAVAVRRRQVAAVSLLTVLVVLGVVATQARASSVPTSAIPPAASPPARTSSPPPSPSPEPVLQRASGSFEVVPGSVRAPGRGEVLSVRVEVERGTGVAAAGFADAVMATLNDPRSWGHGDSRTFARTAGPADIRVILASPDTSAALCRPLVTRGTLSCSVGEKAIITTYRWARGTPDFADLGVYRQYVVNHEVGHVLGKGHEPCPGAAQPAPVMQQQTIKVAPCTPNAWPSP